MQEMGLRTAENPKLKYMCHITEVIFSYTSANKLCKFNGLRKSNRKYFNTFYIT